jgi:hypothetical protein
MRSWRSIGASVVAITAAKGCPLEPREVGFVEFGGAVVAVGLYDVGDLRTLRLRLDVRLGDISRAFEQARNNSLLFRSHRLIKLNRRTTFHIRLFNLIAHVRNINFSDVAANILIHRSN